MVDINLVLKVLRGLSYLRGGQCWCEFSIGNPMYHDHTAACKEAKKLYDALQEEATNANLDN